MKLPDKSEFDYRMDDTERRRAVTNTTALGTHWGRRLAAKSEFEKRYTGKQQIPPVWYLLFL